MKAYFKGALLELELHPGVWLRLQSEGWEAVLQKECAPGERYIDHPELIANWDVRPT